jgi:hypothetical protein
MQNARVSAFMRAAELVIALVAERTTELVGADMKRFFNWLFRRNRPAPGLSPRKPDPAAAALPESLRRLMELEP